MLSPTQSEPSQRPKWLYLLHRANRLFPALTLLFVVLAMACGGEVSVNIPGCEKCPERCLDEKSRGRCVQCLVDKHCRSDEKSTKKCTAKNTCVCGSEQDCPKGQHCDGENGCVQCLSNKHCTEPDRPVCVGSRCQQCHPDDQQACSPKNLEPCRKGIQKCRGNGTWGICENFLVCKGNEKCVDKKCELNCPKTPCALDERKCGSQGQHMPGTWRVCEKNAKGCLEWSPLKTCKAKEYCAKGQCTPFQCPTPPCKEGAKRCQGKDAMQTCKKNTQGCLEWSSKTSCGTGEFCHSSVGACVTCKPKEVQSCYSGTPETKGKGTCQEGKKTCKDDGSGFSKCTGEVLPKKETCNNKDDDCDGKTDEDFANLGKSCTKGTGGCKATGKYACKSDGSSTECDAKAKGATKELCDGKDNNCDGNIDENLNRPCYTGPASTRGKGACKDGIQKCINGLWSSTCIQEIRPSTEVCDGKDNNCNGTIDENLLRNCYTGTPSTRKKGLCKDGVQRCTKGVWPSACLGEVKPGTEMCDGKDNNCDGQVDENLIRNCYTGTPSTRKKGLCKDGIQRCTKGSWPSACQGEVKPTQELCDGKDNDCDGSVDESLVRACYTGAAATRKKGLCKDGIQRCTNGQWPSACQGEVKPLKEVCNGKDDDCDGTSDEDFSLQTDANHCGSCNKKCAAKQSCQKGVCKSNQVYTMDVGTHSSIYTSADPTRQVTRGFWLTAPSDFTIVGLRVPTNAGTGPQSVAVIRFNSIPPHYPGRTNSFSRLLYTNGHTGTGWIACNIPIKKGQIIGIFGTRGTNKVYMSMAGQAQYKSKINGATVTLGRLMEEGNVAKQFPSRVRRHDTAKYGRVEVRYTP